MGNIYVTSDLHFCHDREFLWGNRGFNSIREHDEALIKNWNEIVKDDDTVIILGDLMLNDNNGGMNKIRRLNGYKIIILGNHDTDSRREIYESLWNVDVFGHATPFRYKGYSFYLSHYPTLTSNHDVEKPLKSRTINLCGHSHTTNRFADFDLGLIYHVELDAHDMRPVLLDDIIEELCDKVERR